MFARVNWPRQYYPKSSAIYALNEVDVKAPPEVVWKLLVDAENWSSYFPAEDQVKILTGEPELALGTQYSRVTVGFPMHLIVTELDPGRPLAGDGVDGLKQYIGQLPGENHHLKTLRAFQDGPYVFTHGEGPKLVPGVFFDIFRFEDGLIVEHWVFSAPGAPPNQSGHTQTDGPTKAHLSADTEKNKSIVRKYYETIHVSGDHSKIPQYFSGDRCIRHEPGVRDGVAAFRRDLEELVRHRSIDEIKFVLGQGDFVFIAAKGSHENRPCAYIDLYRVEDGKIAERWGFPEEVPPRGEWQNNNGLL